MPTSEQIALLNKNSGDDLDASFSSQLSMPVSEVSTVKPDGDDASNQSSITDEEDENFHDEDDSPQNNDNNDNEANRKHKYPPSEEEQLAPAETAKKEEPQQKQQQSGSDEDDDVQPATLRRGRRPGSANSSNHSREEFAMDFHTGHTASVEEESEIFEDSDEEEGLDEGSEELEPGSPEWCLIWEERYEQWKLENKGQYKNVEKEMKRIECERVELERVRRIAENKDSAHATRILQILGVGLCLFGVLVVILLILLGVVYNGNNTTPVEENAAGVNIHESGETVAPYDPPALGKTNKTFSPIVWPLPTVSPATGSASSIIPPPPVVAGGPLLSETTEPLEDPWLDQVGADSKTTPMSSWSTKEPDPCASMDSQEQPHVGLQCQCQGSIADVTEDISALHKQLVEEVIVPEVYPDEVAVVGSDITSCDPRNQALVWLSSGDTRQGGNMQQRYALATMFFATAGTTNSTSDAATRAAAEVRKTLRRRKLQPPPVPPPPPPTQQDGSDSDGNWREQWLSDDNECRWPGVLCTENQQVTGVILDEHELEGEIPSELTLLVNLQILSLAGNSITGAIPSAIFTQLSNLQELDLSVNDLEGVLPDETSLSTNLQRLDLSDNNLGGSITSGLGLLSNLSSLRISDNDLEETIPETIYNLTVLRDLRLNGNYLSGSISPSIGQLAPTLESLWLGDNELEDDLPQELRQLLNLQSLHLGGNYFNGTLMEEMFADYPNLEMLDLSDNEFSGAIPSDPVKLPVLKELFFHYNSFTGTMPEPLCGLTLGNLTADCGGATPEIACECCTQCFEGDPPVAP